MGEMFSLGTLACKSNVHLTHVSSAFFCGDEQRGLCPNSNNQWKQFGIAWNFICLCILIYNEMIMIHIGVQGSTNRFAGTS